MKRDKLAPLRHFAVKSKIGLTALRRMTTGSSSSKSGNGATSNSDGNLESITIRANTGMVDSINLTLEPVMSVTTEMPDKTVSGRHNTSSSSSDHKLPCIHSKRQMEGDEISDTVSIASDTRKSTKSAASSNSKRRNTASREGSAKKPIDRKRKPIKKIAMKDIDDVLRDVKNLASDLKQPIINTTIDPEEHEILMEVEPERKKAERNPYAESLLARFSGAPTIDSSMLESEDFDLGSTTFNETTVREGSESPSKHSNKSSRDNSPSRRNSTSSIASSPDARTTWRPSKENSPSAHYLGNVPENYVSLNPITDEDIENIDDFRREMLRRPMPVADRSQRDDMMEDRFLLMAEMSALEREIEAMGDIDIDDLSGDTDGRGSIEEDIVRENQSQKSSPVEPRSVKEKSILKDIAIGLEKEKVVLEEDLTYRKKNQSENSESANLREKQAEKGEKNAEKANIEPPPKPVYSPERRRSSKEEIRKRIEAKRAHGKLNSIPEEIEEPMDVERVIRKIHREMTDAIGDGCISPKKDSKTSSSPNINKESDTDSKSSKDSKRDETLRKLRKTNKESDDNIAPAEPTKDELEEAEKATETSDSIRLVINKLRRLRQRSRKIAEFDNLPDDHDWKQGLKSNEELGETNIALLEAKVNRKSKTDSELHSNGRNNRSRRNLDSSSNEDSDDEDLIAIAQGVKRPPAELRQEEALRKAKKVPEKLKQYVARIKSTHKNDMISIFKDYKSIADAEEEKRRKLEEMSPTSRKIAKIREEEEKNERKKISMATVTRLNERQIECNQLENVVKQIRSELEDLEVDFKEKDSIRTKRRESRFSEIRKKLADKSYIKEEIDRLRQERGDVRTRMGQLARLGPPSSSASPPQSQQSNRRPGAEPTNYPSLNDPSLNGNASVLTTENLERLSGNGLIGSVSTPPRQDSTNANQTLTTRGEAVAPRNNFQTPEIMIDIPIEASLENMEDSSYVPPIEEILRGIPLDLISDDFNSYHSQSTREAYSEMSASRISRQSEASAGGLGD